MKLRKIIRDSGQTGFTVLEIIIAMAILGVMGIAAAIVVEQSFQQNGRTTNGMETIEQVENAGYWITQDTLMAQSVTLGTGSGFPLQLGWQGSDGNNNLVTYSFSGNRLQRVVSVNGVPATQNIIASNIINNDSTKTDCSYSLNGAKGVLTFLVTSRVGTSSQTRTYQIKTRVDQPATYSSALSVSTLLLTGGDIGINYSQPVTATGGITPYTWSMPDGSLPSGLTLNSQTGIISGTPSVIENNPPSSFTITVTDSASPVQSTASQNLTIAINPLPTLTTISPLPGGKKSQGYGPVNLSPAYLTISGGTSPYTNWVVNSGSLPPGLSLNNSGYIYGAPSSTGSFTFTVRITDAAGGNAVSGTLSITVS